MFNECVTMVADRVTEVVLNRLAEVEAEKNEPENMTAKQIEKEFFISRQTVNRRYHEGKLTKIKEKGRVLYPRKEVKALFRKCTDARVSSRRYKRALQEL